MVGLLGEWFAAVLVLFLSVYGCVQLIRHLCLWVTRCPRAVCCYRLAVPQTAAAIEPLFRCLQAQAAWADTHTEQTLVLLPPMTEERRCVIAQLTAVHPAVKAVTAAELVAMMTGEE